MSLKSFEEKLKERRESIPAEEKVVSLRPPAEETTLPGFDAEYRAAARPSSQPLTRLAVCMGREGFRPGAKAYYFFQYVHLDSNAEFGYDKDGQVMTFGVAGMRPVRVTVGGRDLLQTMDYIQTHRLAWIRVADRDFSPAEARDEEGKPKPIITRIVIADARTGEVLAGG